MKYCDRRSKALDNAAIFRKPFFCFMETQFPVKSKKAHRGRAFFGLCALFWDTCLFH